MCDSTDIANLSARDPGIRYSTGKHLIAEAKENPAAVYPYLDSLIPFLTGDNNILKWTATLIVGSLAGVDGEKKIDPLLPGLISFLDTGKLITANNAILALANIAVAKPEYRERISGELLKVENYSYDTLECRNIAMGKVMEELTRLVQELKDSTAVKEFARRQTLNTRPATRKKAEKLLKVIERR
jgi:hypothetical protein